MFSFHAYFWNDYVFINGKNKYAANEILTAYLNTKQEEDANEFLYALKHFSKKLLLSSNMDYENFEKYNRNVYAAQDILDEINSWLKTLPPYDKILKYPIQTLPDLLNAHSFFFENGLDDRETAITWDTITDNGFGDKTEHGSFKIHLQKFMPHEPERMEAYDDNMLADLDDFNESLQAFFDGYIAFLESYLAVCQIFLPFVKDYLNKKTTFPSETELANYFQKFQEERIQNFEKVKCTMQSFGYKVLESNQKPILCEEINFLDLQSFLFYDFFRGLRRNFMPNECKLCQKFFLIRGGKYFSFCDNPLPDDKTKTCREVGSRRTYEDKCKNDPIWGVYNRAYKAHYARYMKKKMTVAEFEQWSSFASNLRDQALQNEIVFTEYETEIRK